MKLRLCTLASGSEANCSFVEIGGKKLLVDAGLSFKGLVKALEDRQIGPSELDALLLTHEHTDHVKGLPLLLKKLELPVYCTRGTFEGLFKQALFERIPKEPFRMIRGGESFTMGDVSVTPLPLSHDGAEPVAYRLDSREAHCALVTDLGCPGDLAAALQGLDVLLLEANHDRRMLESGPYPYSLKLRIDGDKGHLSNLDAARLLADLTHPGLQAVLLGHMSRTNNYPPLALETVKAFLDSQAVAAVPRLMAAPAREPSEMIAF